MYLKTFEAKSDTIKRIAAAINNFIKRFFFTWNILKLFKYFLISKYNQILTQLKIIFLVYFL